MRRQDVVHQLTTAQKLKLWTAECGSESEPDGANNEEKGLLFEQRKLRSTEAAIKLLMV